MSAEWPREAGLLIVLLVPRDLVEGFLPQNRRSPTLALFAARGFTRIDVEWDHVEWVVNGVFLAVLGRPQMVDELDKHRKYASPSCGNIRPEFPLKKRVSVVGPGESHSVPIDGWNYLMACDVQGANGLIGAGQGRSQSLSPPPMVVFMAARPAVFWAAMVDMISVEPQLNPYLTSTST